MYGNGLNGHREGFLGPKMKKTKRKYSAKRSWEEKKNMGCHISLTAFLAGVSPRAATMAKY